MTETAMKSSISPGRAKVVEQVVLSVQTAGLRKMAIASVDTDPASRTLAVQVAAVAAGSGRRTLLIDLADGGEGGHWHPGKSDAPVGKDAAGRGFDTLSAPDDEEGRAAFNNPSRISEALDGLLETYDLVLLHASGLITDGAWPVNPIAACAATEGVVMVLPVGEVPAQKLERSVALLEAAGARVVGTVIDDRGNPSLGDDMARGAERVFSFAPPIGRWLAKKLRGSDFLRTPIFQ
ncbi:MAG: hypothetical protein R3D67_02695 [Hyphomicrobiaceae bacterium]